MHQVAVFGAGSWGTAFSALLADAGCKVALWGRRRAVVDAINATSRNPYYFPEVTLPAGITATRDPAVAARNAEAIFLCIPAQTMRENLSSWAGSFDRAAPLVSLVKGIEVGTGLLMSQLIADLVGIEPGLVAVVSGPNLAKEIIERQPAAAVVACEDQSIAERLQRLCHGAYYRAYTSTDVIGCEVGGTVKNVIAMGVGIAEGQGLGSNAKASLITRGLAETVRLATALGGDARTLSGLAGVGDLIATCMSPLSRNHTMGLKLGQGLTVTEAVAATKQTAEGVTSCESVLKLAEMHGIEMPITQAVAHIVEGTRSASEVVTELMRRAARPEY